MFSQGLFEAFYFASSGPLKFYKGFRLGVRVYTSGAYVMQFIALGCGTGTGDQL